MNNIIKITLLQFLCICSGLLTHAQSNVGINTTAPQRSLEVFGASEQHVRLHTTASLAGEAALELLLGNQVGSLRDYKLGNTGPFRLSYSNDNFETSGSALWHLNYQGNMGIGTTSPQTRLHIEGGEEASNSGDGYLVMGPKSGANIVLDNNEILARNNGATSSLQIQGNGGSINISNGGGNTYFALNGGNLGIGTSSPNSRLSVDNHEFQLSLQNPGPSVNRWYIGATNDTWLAGDNQLVFSPSTSSADAVLRLQDVIENDGNVAPVMIRSSASQTLLLDGNEIDTKSGPLYINYNSEQNTYINPSGGRVGIGTADPTTTLQIISDGTEPALRVEYQNVFWDIDPNADVNWLGFNKNGWIVGHVNGATGQWVTISDRNVKRDIVPLESILDKVNQLNVYEYTYKHDSSGKKQIGLLAQETEPVIPEIVDYSKGYYGIAYSKLSVLILKALQEQQTKIDRLKLELNSLMGSQRN